MATDWITTAEATRLTGYHPERVRELAREGRVKARKFGVVWQVSKQSVLAYVKAAAISNDKRLGPK
jgi:excisionase family DNA binding protein